MIEVDKADFGTAGAGEGAGAVGTYAAATYYDYKGGAEFGEACVGEEDAVTG